MNTEQYMALKKIVVALELHARTICKVHLSPTVLSVVKVRYLKSSTLTKLEVQTAWSQPQRTVLETKGQETGNTK